METNPDKKLEKLNTLLGILRDDTLTPSQVREFITVLVNIVKTNREDFTNQFQSISQENIRKVHEGIQIISEKHYDILSEFDKKSKKYEGSIQEKIDSFESMLNDAKSSLPKDGADADEESIIASILERIELPENDAFELVGEDIVEKINTLPIDEDRYLIDASHIKNLPTVKSLREGGFGAAHAFLGVTHDASLTGDGLTTPLSVVSASGFTLTTIGSSGPATFTSGVLNIPQYSGGSGAVTSVNGQTGTVVLTASDVGAYSSTNPSGFISNATGLISQGTNVTITGSGTTGSPYVINAAASAVTSVNGQTGVVVLGASDVGAYSNTNPSGYISGIAWGQITGTLSAQTDLQTALNAKYDASNPSAYISNATGLISAGTNVSITGSGTIASPYVINSSGGGGSSTFLSDGTYTSLSGDGSIGTPYIVDVDFSSFTTDSISTGTTNLYSQWTNITGGIQYAGSKVAFIPTGTTGTIITATSTEAGLYSSISGNKKIAAYDNSSGNYFYGNDALTLNSAGSSTIVTNNLQVGSTLGSSFSINNSNFNIGFGDLDGIFTGSQFFMQGSTGNMFFQTAGIIDFDFTLSGGDEYAFPTTNGAGALTNDGSGNLSWVPNGATVALNGITAATGTNTINNASYAQEWQWNSLASDYGMTFSSNSVDLTNGLVSISLSGANSTSGVSTSALTAINSRTGVGANNVGLTFNVSSAEIYNIGVNGTVGGGTYAIGAQFDSQSSQNAIGISAHAAYGTTSNIAGKFISDGSSVTDGITVSSDGSTQATGATITATSPSGLAIGLNVSAAGVDADNSVAAILNGKVAINTTDVSAATLTLGKDGGSDGNIQMNNASGGSLNLFAASGSTGYSFVFPSDAGTNTYLLATDGTGNTSWVAPATGNVTGTGTAMQVAIWDDTQDIYGEPTFFVYPTSKQVKIGTDLAPLDNTEDNTFAPMLVTGQNEFYLSYTIYNYHPGNTATSDFIACNRDDDGTIFGGHFIDMGINAPDYDSAAAEIYNGGANAGYIMVNGGTLTLMTQKGFSVDVRTGGYSDDTHLQARFLSNEATLVLGVAGTSATNGKLRLGNTNGENLTIQTGSSTTSWNLTLPIDAGTNTYVLATDGTGVTSWVPQSGGGGGSGTVTTVSVVSANGFAGSVSSPTTTPAITISTSITGLLKGNGTAISAATAGTDYLTPTGSAASLTSFPTFNQNTTGSAAKWTTPRTLAGNSVDGGSNVAFANKFIVQGTSDAGLSAAQFLGALGTGIVKNTTTTGVLSIATAGTDYQAPITLTTTGTSGAATFASNTLNIPNYTYTLPTATTSVLGGVKVDGTSITITGGVISATGGGSGDMVLASVQTVTGAKTFNSGKLILAGSTSGTTILNAAAVAGSGTVVLPTTGTLATLAGSETLSNKDLSSGTNTFPTFNQSTTGSAAFLTTSRNIAITGDIAWNVNFNGAANATAAGTLATVNSNVGTFTNATITVNAKGLITAASNGTVVSSITGTANQVIASASTGAVTLSLPQDIATTSTPQFQNIGIGGAASGTTGVLVSGSNYGLNLIAATGSILPAPNTNATLYRIAGTIIEAGSGTHPLLAAMFLGITTVTGNAGLVTNTAGMYIEGPMTATVTGKNYALWSDDGTNRFDGLFNANGTDITANQVWGANNAGTAMEGKTITAGTNVTVTHGTGSITIAATGGSGSPGGSTTQLQYNNAGAFAGMSRVTTNGNDLIFTGQASPTYTAGKLVYDTDNESLTFTNNDSAVSLQIGQEQWLRVINKTGSTIPNGSAVYLNGVDATTSLPTIGLAKADAGATTIGAGLTTESIANNAIGYVTVIGVVHGLDTSAMTAGATVYISATTAGALVTTAPLSPNYRYRIGIVGVSSATVGTINVTPSTAALGNGSANQVFGMNNAGTAQEVKTIAVSGINTVTNTANTITIGSDQGSIALLADFNTSNTTATSTNLAFTIAANAIYDVVIEGTASKAVSNSGLKIAVNGPVGMTIKGYQQGGAASTSTALANGLITNVGVLGVAFATGIATEVPFRVVVHVKNSSTAGSVTLQAATVTSNTATIYAGTKMSWIKSTEV